MCILHICVCGSISSTLSKTNLPSGELLKAEAVTYPHWGLSVEDAEASKLHVPRHPSRYELAAGESLELHVLLGMFPPVALGLGETQRGKERPLKVASGEALNTSWIIPPPLPFTLYHNCLQNESKPSCFGLQAWNHLI